MMCLHPEPSIPQMLLMSTKYAEDFKARIKCDICDIEKLISDNGKQICNLRSSSKDYLCDVDQRKSEIIGHSEQVKAIVDKHRDMLLIELEIMKKKQVKEYVGFEEDLQLQKISLESFKKYSSEVIDKARPADTARVANDLSDRAAALKRQAVPQVKQQARICFNKGEVDRLDESNTRNILGTLSGE